VIAVVVILLIAAVVLLAGRDGNGEERDGSPPGTTATTSAAPADSITYEITGTINAPLSVAYMDATDTVQETVRTLPWSTTVSPKPKVANIFAISTDFISGQQPDVTIGIKSGDSTLKTCEISSPCVATP